jgi:hypothetical protein
MTQALYAHMNNKTIKKNYPSGEGEKSESITEIKCGQEEWTEGKQKV